MRINIETALVTSRRLLIRDSENADAKVIWSWAVFNAMNESCEVPRKIAHCLHNIGLISVLPEEHEPEEPEMA